MRELGWRLLGVGLLLLLHVVPLDLMTTPLWFAGLFILVSAARALVRQLRGPRSRALVAIALLSVLLYPASCLNQVAAWGAAGQRVCALADLAQQHCDRHGACPDVQTLCGRTDCGSAGTTIRHEVRYAPSEDRRSFHAWSRLSIDDSASARGGVGQPRVCGYRVDGEPSGSP